VGEGTRNEVGAVAGAISGDEAGAIAGAFSATVGDEVRQRDKSIAADSLAEEEVHTNAEKYTESAAWHSVEASDEQYQSLVMFTELSKVESWSHSQSTS
jgi:3-hydroxy-3-methylglutaryl CoA synthase